MLIPGKKHIVTAEIVSTALCFEDNFEIILIGFTYNCLNLLFANVDKLNIKQEKINTLRWFFFLRNLRPRLFTLISQQGYSSFSYFFYFRKCLNSLLLVATLLEATGLFLTYSILELNDSRFRLPHVMRDWQFVNYIKDISLEELNRSKIA